MEKQQTFFCEFCKSEVPQNATTCTVCGRTFAAVKCPKCGTTGTADEFSNGCPFCGYAAKASAPERQRVPEKQPVTKQKTPRKSNQSSQLNTWLFYTAAVAAIGVLAALLFVR